MKLRQKLVAVLSASMIITSVPVVTMADSTNTISVYNYNIKNTTVGFTTTSTAIKTDTTTAAGLQVYTGTENTGSFSAASIPGIDIKPVSTYVLGGSATSPAQTAFIHLTEKSSFQMDALLFYIDALNNTDGSKTTKMYFDDQGKVQQNNTAAWNGKTKEEILEMPETLTVSITNPAARATTAGMKFQVIDVNEFTEDGRKYSSTLRVDLFGTFEKGEVYRIPLLAKVGGDDEVLIKLDGRDSFITSNTFTLTEKLTDKRISVAAESNKITVDDIEEIGAINITETAIDALQKDGNTNRKIKITLPTSSDLEFNLTKTKKSITATGKRGFYGEKEEGSDISVAYGTSSRNSVEDRRTLIVELPNWSDPTAKGEITLTGIFVQPEEQVAAIGDVNVTIEEYVADAAKSTNLVEKTTVKVAEIKEYDVTLKVKDDAPVSVKAGRSGIVNDTAVTFILEEAVKDSLVDSRKIEFTLENGYIFGPADIDTENEMTSYTSNQYKEKALARFKELITEEEIKFEEKAKNVDLTSLKLDINQDGQVIGFTAVYPELTAEKADKLKITIPVATNVQATGEIKVKANNLFTRSDIEDVECVVGKVVEPIKVDVETAQIKVGLQAQKAGSITITETEKGMLERGWLFLAADAQEGITFDKLPTIEVKDQDGKELEIKNIALSKDKTMIGLEVTRTSEEASVIEIKDITFTADRTVPEASYDLAIWGTALTDENVVGINNFTQNALYTNKYFNQISDKYVVEDFISMTTKNTEDITVGGLRATTTSFVMGESKFTVNGETETMDVVAYAKDGYTMIPVRYLAKAFGIEGNAIQYDKATSTATIIAGNKVIAITAGQSFIIVNGTKVPMATKAEVKDGRMCVPMAYIAAALGVDKSWDAATKTATFTNVAK